PLRRAEDTEIGQVSVAARLHGKAGRGRARQVARHGQRGAAVVRERRHQHAAVPDRHQVRNARLPLPLQEGDRIRRVGRAIECRVAVERRVFAGRLPQSRPLVGEQPAALGIWPRSLRRQILQSCGHWGMITGPPGWSPPPSRVIHGSGPDGSLISVRATSRVSDEPTDRRSMILPLALAQFIASYAATNMNVAISAIAKDLGTTVAGVQTAITLFT